MYLIMRLFACVCKFMAVHVQYVHGHTCISVFLFVLQQELQLEFGAIYTATITEIR